MKKVGFQFFLLILIQSNLLAQALGAENRCETNQDCPITGLCECAMTPGATERYYYFTFNGIKREVQLKYVCQFDSSPRNLLIMLDGSKFPKGTTHECIGECPELPAKIILHTENMVSEESSMIIAVRAPAPTDIPTEIKIRCNQE